MDMNQLPDCVHRGVLLSPEESLCKSESVVHIGAVNADICNACEFRNEPASVGLGDTVHKILRATGVDNLVHWVVGDCGCDKRRARLNELVPYASNPCGPISGSVPLNPVRNLMMHIYPLRELGVWRFNVEQIMSRMHLFNGKRAVTIVVDDHTDTADDVIAAFAGERIELLTVAHNSHNLWEMQSLPKMLEHMRSCDPNHITFYCHSKGARGPERFNGPTFHEQPRVKWAKAMYGACLDDMPFVEQQLAKHTFAGPFKRKMLVLGGEYRSSWHFSGTFYWIRNERLFSLPKWNSFNCSWNGAETYPGQVVGWGEAANLFCVNPPCLYLQESWTERVDAEWEAWQREHCATAETPHQP